MTTDKDIGDIRECLAQIRANDAKMTAAIMELAANVREIYHGEKERGEGA